MSLMSIGKQRIGLSMGAAVLCTGLSLTPAAALDSGTRDALTAAVGIGAGLVLLDQVLNPPRRTVVVEERYVPRQPDYRRDWSDRRYERHDRYDDDRHFDDDRRRDGPRRGDWVPPGQWKKYHRDRW